MNCQILIIDFGSQLTKLIARRVREIGIYCEIIPYTRINLEIITLKKPKALILSGGPASVDDKDSPRLPESIFEKGIPILGICFGLQLICKYFKGLVSISNRREFGKASIRILSKSRLFEDTYTSKKKYQVWMSHSDTLEKLPNDFKAIASSENSKYAAIENTKKNIFGLQFHPEVNHTFKGERILENFLVKISKCKKDWNMKSFKIEMIENIKKQVGSQNVVCGLSGGVDSTVTAILINKAIGSNLRCIFVNTGLMRKGEPKQIEELFKKNFNINLEVINASELFFKKLKGITNPEKKRKIIGKLFIQIFDESTTKNQSAPFLAQGTLYPDVIESISVFGNSKVTIKSHHNVGGLPKKMKLKLIEPLRNLFKDEVRALGIELKIPNNFISRHPFPGPGLAIRIIGEVTKKRVKILQEADSIFIRALKEAKLYNKIWQAFCVLLPTKSVGVMGDNRTYEQVCVLRAVTSLDGMTSEAYSFDPIFISKCANQIVNQVKGINRVCYDYTSKPPGTIEWE